MATLSRRSLIQVSATLGVGMVALPTSRLSHLGAQEAETTPPLITQMIVSRIEHGEHGQQVVRFAPHSAVPGKGFQPPITELVMTVSGQSFALGQIYTFTIVQDTGLQPNTGLAHS